jgi:hypothetical protein
MKPRVKRADFYIIANFQDDLDTAIEPEKIKSIFNLKTYGFSAIKDNSDKKLLVIINEILNISIKTKFGGV